MRGGACLAALVVCLALAASPARARVHLVIGDVRAADSIASRPPDRDRDRALAEWAKRASLPDLVYLLRHPAAALGGAEPPMLRAALKRAPRERPALRRRLALRLAEVSHATAAHVTAAAREAGAPLRLRASVFRVACLLPDSGGYEADARALCLAVAVGLRTWRDREGRRLDLVHVPSGDETPAAMAAAFARAADSAAVVVGAMEPGSAAALAARAQDVGGALVTPASMGEVPGASSPALFQIGPADAERGAALARALLTGSRRRKLGVLLPSGGTHRLLDGFARVADSVGAEVVWRGSYAPDAGDLRLEIGAMVAAGVDLLFWDGEARDAESLIRQMVLQKARLDLCGGANLDPRRHHTAAAATGLRASWPGEDWMPDPRTLAATRLAGESRNEAMMARGYLAGRAIADAVASGALAPEELVAALASRRASDAALADPGFLSWTTGVSIPVFTAAAGRTERVR